MLVLVTDLPLLDSRKIISVTQSHIVKDVAMDVGSGRWGGGMDLALSHSCCNCSHLYA